MSGREQRRRNKFCDFLRTGEMRGKRVLRERSAKRTSIILGWQTEKKEGVTRSFLPI